MAGENGENMITKVYRTETKALGDGRIEAIVSTEDVDRDGDIIRAEGWVLDNFMKHPVLLASHDYRNLRSQIGEWESMQVEGKKLRGVARYYIGAGNEEADWAYYLAQQGMAAYSVGFSPLEWKDRESSDNAPSGRQYGREYTKQELLEVSHVTVPANQNALQLIAKGHSVLGQIAAEVLEKEPQQSSEWSTNTATTSLSETDTVDVQASDVWSAIEAVHAEIEALSEEIADLRTVIGDKGSSPRDVSRQTADEGAEWQAPRLQDFTDESWDDLTDAEKRRIAGHFAWARVMPPEAFGDLKLPHHRASDGAVVWNGVRAALGALRGARGGVAIPDADRREVYDHLASHYRQFDREPPEFQSLIGPERESTPGKLTVARILGIESDEEVSNV